MLGLLSVNCTGSSVLAKKVYVHTNKFPGATPLTGKTRKKK